jgi:hypothetical protein
VGLLAPPVLYDPAVAVTKATTAALVMTAFDTTNLRSTFLAPRSGRAQVRIACVLHGAVTFPSILLGVLEGATVRGRVCPIGGLPGTALATMPIPREAVFVIGGLTPGQSYTWDAAYGVEVGVAATGIKYGGPNNTVANDAFGAIIFEIWEV